MDRFCEVCGMGDMVLGEETSILYCRNCGAQSNQYLEEAFDGDDAHMFNTTFVRERGTIRNAEQLQPSQQKPADLTPGSTLLEEMYSLPDGYDVVRMSQGIADANRFSQGLGPSQEIDFSGLGLGSGSQLMRGQFVPESSSTAHISKDELASAIRKSYVEGLQKILQLQCEYLVKEVGVAPLVCGIAGVLWLKFVASTRVFENVWADEAVMVAEHRNRVRKEKVAAKDENPALGKQKQKQPRKASKGKGLAGLLTSFGRQLSLVWLIALKERIPLSITLSVCYLSCYIARETILPTDIHNWAINGQLPYLAAFVEISKSAADCTFNARGGKQFFPLKPKLMFQPRTMVAIRVVELQAGFVAERVGVQLPPVNYHGISALFLRDLGLRFEKLLPYVYRLYDWYTPSGLFLSSRATIHPTRVYVMAMLIIAIKILYNLDGHRPQGADETDTHRTRSNENHTRSRAKEVALANKQQEINPSEERRKEFGDTDELLERLEFVEKKKPVDHDEELSKYLKYCQNVIFTGYDEDLGMDVEPFWEIYEKNVTKRESQPVNLDENADGSVGEDIGTKLVPQAGAEESAGSLAPSAGSLTTDWGSRLDTSNLKKEQKIKDFHTGNGVGAHFHEGAAAPEFNKVVGEKQETSSLIMEMEEAGFSCLPPLADPVRPNDYVRYSLWVGRKNLIPIHEEYFRVLRACGKLIEVHTMALHRCVQKIEKGIVQLESNIEKLLLDEKVPDVVKFAKAVERRKPERRRNKRGEAENVKSAAERIKHLTDLSYL